jgi:glycosyltransferase involved in cell wall biosynthesis
MGLNLQWYAEQGFGRLEGFDIDPAAIAAARELASTSGSPARFWVDDAMKPCRLPAGPYDVIEALNTTMYMEGFTFENFLATYLPLLADAGVLLFDVIDASYNNVADNQYATADLDKPVNDRRPSEYRIRLAETDIVEQCRSYGLAPVNVWRGRERVPRRVLALRREPAAASAAAPASSRTDRPRILLVADVPNWIFERHARTLDERLGDEFDFTVIFKNQPFDEDAFDLIYPLEWWLVPPQQIRTPAKYVTGIRSHCSWDSGRFDALADHLSTKFSRVHVVSQRLLRRFAPHVPGVVQISHGVDTEHFTAATRADQSGGQVRLGWAGNRFSSAQKGFAEIIEPLGRIPGVSLVFCGYSDRNLSMAEMRGFYDSIDVYVCASDYEGNNNSLLEAASMGRAIVTTDNGAVREYLKHAESALIVRRALPAFTEALVRLRDNPALRASLGVAAAQSVRARFDWKDRAEDYRAFFREALARADRDRLYVTASTLSVCPA